MANGLTGAIAPRAIDFDSCILFLENDADSIGEVLRAQIWSRRSERVFLYFSEFGSGKAEVLYELTTLRHAFDADSMKGGTRWARNEEYD